MQGWNAILVSSVSMISSMQNCMCMGLAVHKSGIVNSEHFDVNAPSNVTFKHVNADRIGFTFQKVGVWSFHCVLLT